MHEVIALCMRESLTKERGCFFVVGMGNVHASAMNHPRHSCANIFCPTLSEFQYRKIKREEAGVNVPWL